MLSKQITTNLRFKTTLFITCSVGSVTLYRSHWVKVGHICIPFCGLLGGTSCLVFSRFFRWPIFLGLWFLSSIFKAHKSRMSLSHMKSHLPPLLPSSSSFKNPCDYIGSTRIIQDTLFLLRLADKQFWPHL